MRKINILNTIRNIYDFQLICNKQHIGSCKLILNDQDVTINHIEIIDSHKKEGHGSWLLQETEKILKNDYGIKKISLLGWQPSGSFDIVDFYKKNGYVNTYKHTRVYDDYVTIFDLYDLHKII